MCLHVAHLLSQEGHALGRQRGERWASVGQWGGADAHQSTVLVAPRVLGTGQMLGGMDAPDPGWAVPLSTGGSEDHWPQAAMGGQERGATVALRRECVGGGQSCLAGAGLEKPRLEECGELWAPHPNPELPHAHLATCPGS